MIVQELNKIKIYFSNPSIMELKNIIPILNSDITEEYFLIRAIESDKTITIFNQIIKLKPNYFTQKIENIFQGKYSNKEFYALRFLVSVSKNITKKDFLTLSKQINYFINKTKDQNPNKNTQIYWFVSEAILNYPIHKITFNHLSFIYSYGLLSHSSMISYNIKDQLISKTLENENKEFLLKLLNKIILKFEVKTNSFGIHTRFDNYYLSEIFSDKNITAFSKLIGKERLLEFSLKKIKKAIAIDQQYFTNWSIPSIEETEQILDKSKIEYLLVKFCRIQIENETFQDSYISQEFLNSKHIILKRLGIHYIASHYNKHKNLFWNIHYNPIDNSYLKHEVFMLLKNNSKSINILELEKLFSWMDTCKFKKYNNISDEDLLKFKVIESKEYLEALTGCSTSLKEKIEVKKNNLNKINSDSIDHPGINTYYTNTPEFKDDFSINSKYSDAKIIISKILKKESPSKSDLTNIKNIDLLILSNIIREYQELWEAKNKFNWKNLLSIIDFIINSSDFLISKNSEQFLGYTSWLIRSATENDSNAISDFELELAKNICVKMLSFNLNNDLINKNPLFDILNNTDGKVFDATLNVLLRNARLNKKEDNDRWYPDIKKIYHNILISQVSTKAFIWNLAGNLPQYGYLDIKWVQNMLPFIFPTDSETWKFSMLMYHQRVKIVYRDLFTLLYKEGHYDRALNEFIGEEKGIKEICEHILLASLANWEGQELENSESLINKIFVKQEKEQIRGLVTYFLTNRNYKITDMIKVWELILEKTIDLKVVAQDLIKLADEIKYFDSHIFEIINKTLKNIDRKDNLFHLVRTLTTNINSNDIENRAKLLMTILGNNLNQYYFGEPLQNFAKILYSTNKKLADEFVLTLIKKRGYVLLDVYNEFNTIPN